jgi:hypothetical protein
LFFEFYRLISIFNVFLIDFSAKKRGQLEELLGWRDGRKRGKQGPLGRPGDTVVAREAAPVEVEGAAAAVGWGNAEGGGQLAVAPGVLQRRSAVCDC